MSYARWSPESDVYVFMDCHGYLRCCGCGLEGEAEFTTTAEMLEHLERHAFNGHSVPSYCTDRLKEEAAGNDAWMARVAAGMCPRCEDARQIQNPGPEFQPCPTCRRDEWAAWWKVQQARRVTP